MKFSRVALAGVTAAACCAGLWAAADRRTSVWQRRFAREREGGVLLVAPGLFLKYGQHERVCADAAGIDPGRATIQRPTASF